MTKNKLMIVAGYQLSAQPILRFNAHTRLMCNSCGTVSNNHIIVEDSLFDDVYHGHLTENVCLHKCHRCGYVDNMGSGFTDSGNYQSDETDGLHEWEEEIADLEDELAVLRHKLENGRKRWAELWNTNEDA